MAAVMWWCSCCLRFKFSPEELEQRHKSQEIDRLIEKDKQSLRRQVKLLLLGAGESGKSTFLKQMRIIHGIKFEPELVKEYQHVIYQNIVKGMKVLVDARDKLNIPWENSNNSSYGYHILKFENSMMLDDKLFLHYAPSLLRLWNDAGIRKAFDRRREFQLSDSVQYFFSNLERIARTAGGSWRNKAPEPLPEDDRRGMRRDDRRPVPPVSRKEDRSDWRKEPSEKRSTDSAGPRRGLEDDRRRMDDRGRGDRNLGPRDEPPSRDTRPRAPEQPAVEDSGDGGNWQKVSRR